MEGKISWAPSERAVLSLKARPRRENTGRRLSDRRHNLAGPLSGPPSLPPTGVSRAVGQRGGPPAV